MDKEKLEIEVLKWQAGYRRFITPIMTLIVALISGYFGYYLPTQQELKNEQFKELIKHLDNSTDLNLQLYAIEELKNYGKRAYLPLRNVLSKTKNKVVQAKIEEILPKDLGFDDKIEYSYFREDIGKAQKEEEWIYVGNYSYEYNGWVNQLKNLGYNTTLNFNLIKKLTPNDIIGKIFLADVSINTRSNYPYRQDNITQFAPKVDVVKKGNKVKVLNINETEHPNKKVKRIWAQVERIKIN